ncbi:2-amino-4-hydroxy-6-hydroxymethyldihydropteridine diphosphokinase [Selenomonas sp. oral taxon 138]|uniref:2-amino-4-hydroxy-6- hydroxymethyldihydropteridine diphosphokinase n=1 Tax=Selenomonas sp. oral taxon 138 TaxID=712532 RepID=UPI0002A1ABAC|nr:2-amino-4-hydroxy-6-hydroxymethyldihydropteridine diphosphokinase [Selenomonas sp. oral taxon 138]EKX99683.1 2-amino-4-hydroxy-6-hydroxymethyldihydropteridine diphosphokinase [Selenomonas sp. oral taxon 138 str. F0429]
MRRTAYIGLGANLGDRGETMRAALRRVAELPSVNVERVSAFYETPPWGKTDQPPFLNAAARIVFDGTPYELLADLQRIEQELGRVRHEHWGARTIDLDILHIEGLTCAEERLILPHPYLTQRAFVLVPLHEIAPALRIHKKFIASYYDEIDRTGIVRVPELSVPYPLMLMAACDEAGGIGRNGQLLTHCAEDMAHFRETTMGGIVIMGRRTMESLPGRQPLTGRENIVLSRTLMRADGFHIVHDLAALWTLLGRLVYDAERLIFAIGGEECYRLLLPYVHRAYVTRLAGTYVADVFLPSLTDFVRTGCRRREDCIFEIYERV